MYAWALDAHGRPVHITQAARGASYVCPVCGGKMVARQGAVKQHHFAHDVLQVCQPDEVDRIGALGWLARQLEGCIVTRRTITSTWGCPLCKQPHTVNLLDGIRRVQPALSIGEWEADLALLDDTDRPRLVLVTAPPTPDFLAATSQRGIAVIVLDLAHLRREPPDLAGLLSGATIYGGPCTTQQDAASEGVVTTIDRLRALLTQAVSAPPHHVFGPLERHQTLTHVFTLGAQKLWLPPILWQRAIGGLHHTISPALQIISQEWPQPDGAIIALYYITVKGGHAIAVRRFPPGEPVYARLDTSMFRTPRITAVHVARSFAEC